MTYHDIRITHDACRWIALLYVVGYYVMVNWGDAHMVALRLPPSAVALGLTLEVSCDGVMG